MPDWAELADRARADDDAGRAAAQELVQGGASALPAVLHALSDGPPGALAGIVRRFHDPAAVPLLIEGLQADSYDVVKAGALALGSAADGRAVEPLLALLTDEKRGDVDRSLAAEALGDLGALAEPAADALRRCVEEKRPELEWEEFPVLLVNCAVALAKLGDHGAVGAVLEALRAPAPSARSLAATGLRIVTGPAALPALADALRDPSREVRRAAVDPLFLFGVAASAEALVVAAGDEVDDIAELALLRLGDLLGEPLDPEDGEDEARTAWERHRSDLPAGACCRSGHPLRVLDLVSELTGAAHRRADLCEELRIVTGLPVAELVEERGVDGLRERVEALELPDGGYYKWGRPMPVPAP